MPYTNMQLEIVGVGGIFSTKKNEKYIISTPEIFCIYAPITKNEK